MAYYSAHYAGNLAGPSDAPAEFRLDETEIENVKVLGARLRSLRVLPKGWSIRSAVQQGRDWFVYPRPRTSMSPIHLKRTDLWTVIGRGKAGWHAARPGVSSDGGTLEPISGTYGDGRKWSRPGYLSEAAEGARVYDADRADYATFARFVMSGPMLSVTLAEGEVDAFTTKDAEAAAGMLGPGGLSGGFDTLAERAIAEVKAGKRYSSLDRVSWPIYRALLEQVGGVRFGTVSGGKVVWEE